MTDASAPVAARAGIGPQDRLRGRFADWAAGALLVYGLLFGAGALLFGSLLNFALWGAAALAGGMWLHRALRRNATAPSP